MKKFHIFILLISNLAINPAFTQQIDTYLKFITNGTNADGGSAISQTPDGNYIISANTGGQLAFANSDGWIIKINPDGDTIWTSMAGGNGLDMLGSIIVNNNKYISVGFKYVWLSDRQGWIVEYDSAGNKLTDKTYGGPLPDAFRTIIPSGDGGFLCFGSTRTYGTDSTQDAWLVKLNSSFDTLWTTHYDLGTITGDTGNTDDGNGIIPFGNNSFLMSVNSCQLCDGTDGIAWYAVIDSSGKITGQAHVFDKGPKNKFEGGIRPTSDGGAIITGATSQHDSLYFHFPPLPPMRCEDMWIVKVKPDADTAWTRIYGKDSIYDGGWSIFQTADGGYFMSAYSQIDCTTGYDFDNVWVMRLNSTGDTVNVCRWGGPQNDDLYCIIPAADGGAIGVGWYNASSLQLPIPGDCDILIFKTDCNILTNITEAGEMDNNVHLYPNPASDQVYIVPFFKHNTQPFSCELYSTEGKLINKTNGLKQASFDISSANSGLYFVRIIMNNKIVTKKLEIIR